MKYLIIRNYSVLLTLAVCLGGTSCSRYFTPSQQAAYTKHQIDSTITEDPAYIRQYAPYKQQLEAEMNRAIGHTDVSLTKPSDAPETLLGDFFADALLAEGRKLHPEIEFSFGTKGGLRSEIQRGELTIGTLFELMPFENELVVLELSGDSVKRLAEFIARTGGQPVGGLRMGIENNRPVAVQIAGKPLDTSRSYKLLTYDYLANGGDNSPGLGNPINRINLGKKVRESLIDYVTEQTKAGKHINMQLDGRITNNP